MVVVFEKILLLSRVPARLCLHLLKSACAMDWLSCRREL